MAQETSWDQSDETLLQADLGFRLLLAVLLAVTALRVLGLAVSNAELFYDEAQYWVWAQEPAFGYFTKPPLIAWLIGSVTAVCGDSPFCVRVASPILHLAAALLIYALARKLFDQRTAFWSSLVYITTPGTSVSSTLMSTDVPLLFFWVAAMLAVVYHYQRPSLAAGLAMGVAIGLGLNAKYAMIYLVLCIGIFALVSPAGRRMLRHPGTWIGFAVAAALIAPNVYWNYENGFATYLHTRDNADWGGRFPNFRGLLEFTAIQTIIVGPIAFAAFVMAALGKAKEINPTARRFLLSFSLPVFALIMAQAFISRAHGNWAATAFPAATVLAMATMLALQWKRGLIATICINATALIAVTFAGTLTGVITSGPVGGELGKLRGWGEFAQNVQRISQDTGIRKVVFTGRGFTASMVYELRDTDLDVRALTPDPKRPADQFEMTRPWTPREEGPALLFVVGDFDVAGVFNIEAQRIEAFQTRIFLARHSNWIASAWRVN